MVFVDLGDASIEKGIGVLKNLGCDWWFRSHIAECKDRSFIEISISMIKVI
jgi:hypothetical protein